MSRRTHNYTLINTKTFAFQRLIVTKNYKQVNYANKIKFYGLMKTTRDDN